VGGDQSTADRRAGEAGGRRRAGDGACHRAPWRPPSGHYDQDHDIGTGGWMSSRSRRLPKVSDLVVSALRERIINQQLPVGSRLPSEAELMEELNVGRVTVREGLRLLERDGLLEVRRGTTGGNFVRHPDIEQVSESISVLLGIRGTRLREFVEFRQLVEPEAAALAAQHR